MRQKPLYKRIASVVQDVTGADFTMAVYALNSSPSGTTQNKPSTALFGDVTYDTDVETIQGYILTKIFGEEKARRNFKTFMDGQETLKNTSEQSRNPERRSS